MHLHGARSLQRQFLAGIAQVDPLVLVVEVRLGHQVLGLIGPNLRLESVILVSLFSRELDVQLGLKTELVCRRCLLSGRALFVMEICVSHGLLRHKGGCAGAHIVGMIGFILSYVRQLPGQLGAVRVQLQHLASECRVHLALAHRYLHGDQSRGTGLL